MFNGSLVALITPFRDGSIDEPALRGLVEFQIANGTDGIIPCGTTGEAATMSLEEWSRVVEIVIEQTAGRVPIIPGTGSNSTAAAIERTRRAQELGAQAALIVTPYYNKPTQAGLYAHFAAIAEAVDLPIVLYNVPGRTSVNMLPETVVRLAELPNIVGIKEASGSIDQASQIVLEAGPNFAVLSGDDSLTLPMMSVGGQGVVSVMANIAPALVARMTAAALAGDFITARRLHLEGFDLARTMFVETNPAPVKAAAEMLGLCTGELRLPLVPITDASQEVVHQALRDCVHTALPATGQTVAATAGIERQLQEQHA